MSISLDLRIQQLVAQRAILQSQMLRNMSSIHRIAFTGSNPLPSKTETPLVLNNIMLQVQLKAIDTELKELKEQRKLDYLA